MLRKPKFSFSLTKSSMQIFLAVKWLYHVKSSFYTRIIRDRTIIIINKTYYNDCPVRIITRDFINVIRDAVNTIIAFMIH